MTVITHNRQVLGASNITGLSNQNFINRIFELPADAGAGTLSPTVGQARNGRQHLNCDRLYFENCVIDSECGLGMAFVNCNHIHFRNCEFIGTGANATCLAFLARTNHTVFEGCSFRNLNGSFANTALSLLTYSSGENANWNPSTTFENQFRFNNGFNGAGNFLAIPAGPSRFFLGQNNTRVTFTLPLTHWEMEFPYGGEFVLNTEWYRNSGMRAFFIWDGLPAEVEGTLVSLSYTGTPPTGSITFTYDLPIAPPNNLRVNWAMVRETWMTHHHQLINCTFDGGIAGMSTYFARDVLVRGCTARRALDYGLGFEYSRRSQFINCLSHGNAGSQMETVGRCFDINVIRCRREDNASDFAPLVVVHHTCHTANILSPDTRIQVFDWQVAGNMIPVRNIFSRGVNVATSFSAGSGAIS